MLLRSFTAGLIFSFFPVLAAEVPRKAPEFEIQTPDGQRKLLSQYRGKVVAIEFLFTTCPHCQHASQLMNALQKEYGAKGFQPLGVAFNPMAKLFVPDFVRELGVQYPVGYAEREPVHAFLQNNPNEALHVPQIVFIDRRGMIRQQSLPRGDETTATEANMRKTIESLLREPASPAAKPRRSTAGTKRKAS